MRDEDRAVLENAHLFIGLSKEQIDAIAAATQSVWFDTGQAITQAGDCGAAAFLIMSGTVSVADANEASGFQQPLGAGTLVGELAMLTEVTYSATVVAAEPVTALVIERDALHGVLEADPEIAEVMADVLTTRLATLAEELRMVDERFEALEISLERARDAA